MKKVISLIIVSLTLGIILTGCRQSERVSYNVSKEADNFNVERRLCVINARTDKPVFELIGYFAMSNSGYNELEIICQTGINEFKKHYVYLNEWTICVVEDVGGSSVDPYHYEINFLPEMIQPITITQNY